MKTFSSLVPMDYKYTLTNCVCDTDNHRILVFDTELKYLSQVIGGKSSGPGQFDQPWDTSWDSSSMLYVTDSSNHRVCVFDRHGTHLREFGRKST